LYINFPERKVEETKRTKGETMIYKTLHRKLKTE